MNSSELIRTLAAKISRCAHLNGNPLQIAWWLLEAASGKSRAQLAIHNEITLTPAQQAQLDSWIAALVEEQKPLQYILGTVPFLDLDLIVRPPILIPRPETEEWCHKLIELLRPITQPFTILDLCSGSGCIGLALAQALPKAQITALDINPDAVALAQENATRNSITNFTALQSDLFCVLQSGTQFDLIVANPPYISDEEWAALAPQVREWEDPQALIAPEDGLSILKQIIEQAPAFISPNGPIANTTIPQLLLEIGFTQADQLLFFMKGCGYNALNVWQDQSARDRVVTGRIENIPPRYSSTTS